MEELAEENKQKSEPDMNVYDVDKLREWWLLATKLLLTRCKSFFNKEFEARVM